MDEDMNIFEVMDYIKNMCTNMLAIIILCTKIIEHACEINRIQPPYNTQRCYKQMKKQKILSYIINSSKCMTSTSNEINGCYHWLPFALILPQIIKYMALK